MLIHLLAAAGVVKSAVTVADKVFPSTKKSASEAVPTFNFVVDPLESVNNS